MQSRKHRAAAFQLPRRINFLQPISSIRSQRPALPSAWPLGMTCAEARKQIATQRDLDKLKGKTKRGAK